MYKKCQKMIFFDFSKMASKCFQMVGNRVLSVSGVSNHPKQVPNILRNDLKQILENRNFDLGNPFFKGQEATARLSIQK